MSTLPTVAAAASGGLLLAPITVRLVSLTQFEQRRTSTAETVVVTAVVGMLIAATGDLRLAPLVALATAAAVVDLHERRLPDALTGTLALGTTAVVLTARPPAVAAAVTAASCALAAGLAARLISDGVLGWGDVKLLPGLAGLVAAVRPEGVVLALTYAALLLLVTVAAFAAGGLRPGEPVPYGPALVVGAFAALPAVA